MDLAHAYWIMGNRGTRAYYDSAKVTARAALELDPDQSLAHAALASSLLMDEFDWAGAEAEFQRALDLDPNAHHNLYATYLRAAGRYQEAIASLRRVQEREPFKYALQLGLASLYVCDGDPDRAIWLATGIPGAEAGGPGGLLT